MVVWCPNDYLGMGQNPMLLDTVTKAIAQYGAGGTRNISGTSYPIVELEHELAALHEKPAALVFTSGYVANLASLSTLATMLPNYVILSDAWNHASMIEGIRHSGCKKKFFRQNDVPHLEELLKEVEPGRA